MTAPRCFRHLWPRWLLPLGLGLLVLGGRASTARAKRGDRWDAALARGEVLVQVRAATGCGEKEFVIKAVIEAPPERVWRIVERCGRYKDVMPRVVQSAELSRRGSRVRCQLVVDMPFPYSDMASITDAIHEVGQGRWSRRWKLESGDYEQNSGSWQLTRFHDDPARTLVVYRACVTPKAWVPGWIRTQAQKRTMPEMITRIRRAARRK